ncbi:uncharacterized protein V1518DRAFT_415031 [Limtongia smithiae]|uniref:uncharacterized protein n=1 Tax=Limtongia smithiae TaxID=1125753 RepID=UPI0034CF5159
MTVSALATPPTTMPPPSLLLANKPAEIARLFQQIDPFASPSRSTTPSSPGRVVRPYSPSRSFRRAQSERLRKKSLLGIMAMHSSSPAATITASQPLYAPWSRTQLLARLSTFSSSDDDNTPPWPYNPAVNITSPLVWARAGWSRAETSNESTPAVTYCLVCKTTYVLDLVAVQAERTCADQLGMPDSTRVRNAHAERCSWRRRVCAEHLYALNLSADLKDTLQQFDKRTGSFLDSPLPKSLVVRDLAGCDELLLAFYSSHTAYHVCPYDAFKPVFLLSLLGWEFRRDESSPTARCAQCISKMALLPADDCAALDAATHHRPYCPWISAQNPAWRLLHSILASKSLSSSHTTTTTDDLREDEQLLLSSGTTTADYSEDAESDRLASRVENIRKLYVYRPRTPAELTKLRGPIALTSSSPPGPGTLL